MYSNLHNSFQIDIVYLKFNFIQMKHINFEKNKVKIFIQASNISN
jgi:hypothetical protein